jgi:hypothetical protein
MMHIVRAAGIVMILAVPAANAEPLVPFTCATGYTNLHRHTVWGNVQGTNKAAAYLARAVFRCYKKPVGPDRDACIQKVRDRHYVWTLAFKGELPDCLDKAAIMDSTVARMRAFADRIYCAGGTTKCELHAARYAGNLSLRLIGLHMGYLAEYWDGECCQQFEDAPKRKFLRQVLKLPKDCPPCLDLATLADEMDQQIDDHNGETYCATESELR